MVTKKRQVSFYADTDTDLYLSYVDSGIKTKVINRALREFMQIEAVIDLADGARPKSFWDITDDAKNQVLQALGGTGEDKADPHLWTVVQETTPQDFYLYAAKYLALHQLKFGKPYAMRLPPQKLRKHFHEKEAEQEQSKIKRYTVDE